MDFLKTDNDINWGPQGREVFERTYSRLKKDETNETWFDTVTRVVDGNLALVDSKFHLDGERDRLFDLVYNMKAIPAGRHLWTSGVEGRQFVRNCFRSGFEEKLSAHFTFMFDQLMKGGGVGANYSSEYLQMAHPIIGKVDVKFKLDTTHDDYESVSESVHLNQRLEFQDVNRWTVEDSREGWVDALGFLMDSYTQSGHHTIVFDLSQVRASGEIIRGFGGTASGPGPLALSLSRITEILNNIKREHLNPLEAMSVDHAIAQCVIAGNIRRSARMSILHWNDPHIFEFINCKADHADHWTTNISVEVDEAFFEALDNSDSHALEVFNKVTEAMLANGEPGLYNSFKASEGERGGDVRATNPCGEIALFAEKAAGESCNLGHVNLSAYGTDHSGALEAFSLMARVLVRATFAYIEDEEQREIEARNRRIGVGFFGFQEWLGELGVPYSKASREPMVADLLKGFKEQVIESSDNYAIELGIPKPIKHTTVAPTGTIAKLPGTTEGAHPVYSRYYERRVRYAASDPKLAELAKDHEIEDCIYSADTKVVVFHTKDTILNKVDPDLIEQSDEIDISDMLATQALIQEHYADNAVSFTANVNPELPLEDLREAVREYLPRLKGTTIMPDASRPQSPYTRITQEQWEAATDQEVGQGFDECAGGGACPIK